jgi:hypothetical protein
VAGGRLLASPAPSSGREKFAFSIAEVTDALALEVPALRRTDLCRKNRLIRLLRCT